MQAMGSRGRAYRSPSPQRRAFSPGPSISDLATAAEEVLGHGRRGRHWSILLIYICRAKIVFEPRCRVIVER